jgi:hypothetical protein
MNEEDAKSLTDQCLKTLIPNQVQASATGSPIEVDQQGDPPARVRLLKGHTVVALADPNPDDPNSALLTHIQVRDRARVKTRAGARVRG